MARIIIIVLTLFFTVACAPKTRAEIRANLAKKGIYSDVVYLKKDFSSNIDYDGYNIDYDGYREHPLRKGDKVLLKDVYGGVGLADTTKGYIPLEYLEKKPSEVYLNVIAPKGSIIKILNIHPKYKDYIYLKPGKYHIEVKKPGFMPLKKWINISENTNYKVNLKEIEFPTTIPRKIIWNKKYLKQYRINTNKIYQYNNLSWYKHRDKSFNNFKEVSSSCKYLSIPLSQNYYLTGFSVPTLNQIYFGNHYKKFFESYDFYYTKTRISYGNTSYFTEYYSPAGIQDYIKNHNLFRIEYYNNKMIVGRADADNRAIGTRSVLCVNEQTPSNLKLATLVKGILSNKKQYGKNKINQVYSEAFHIKYGKPIIKSVVCKNNQNNCYIEVVSERGGIDRTINISVNKKDYKNFQYVLKKSIIPNPIIEMEYKNDQYKVGKIIGLKNSHEMVLEDQYNKAKYSIVKLNHFIKSYPHDKGYIKKAQKRILKLKRLFKGYTPRNIMTLKGCHFFYPRKLIDAGMYNGIDLTIWNKIDGNADMCRKGYLYGNVVLRFSSDKNKLYTELSGKMRYGLFVGKVEYEGSDMSFDNMLRFTKSGTFQAPKIGPNSDYHIGKPLKGR